LGKFAGLAAFPCWDLDEGATFTGPTSNCLQPFASDLTLVRSLLPSGLMHSKICARAPTANMVPHNNTANFLMHDPVVMILEKRSRIPQVDRIQRQKLR
jgi:prepilin-type processing-associated H-X9-DG protein